MNRITKKNKIRKNSLIVLLGLAIPLASVAQEDIAIESDTSEKAACELSSSPIIPDGAVASEDELIAAQKAYKTFEATTQAYRDCLLSQKAEIEALGLAPEELEQRLAANLAQDNAAVDALVAVAEEFNKAVRAFKAR